MNKAGEISINWGDVIFTVISLGIPILIILFAIFFLRSKKSKQRSKKME